MKRLNGFYTKNLILLIILPFIIGLLTASMCQVFTSNFFYSSIIAFFVSFISHFCFTKVAKSRMQRAIVLQQGLLVSMSVFLFLVLVPLNLDRSISVWLLAKQNNNVSMTNEDYQKNAIDFFRDSQYESNRRVNEQISLGNIERNEAGDLVITERGEILVKIFRFLSEVFNLNQKYTNG
jgi:predicted PurR-regulated permease PerM